MSPDANVETLTSVVMRQAPSGTWEVISSFTGPGAGGDLRQIRSMHSNLDAARQFVLTIATSMDPNAQA